MDDKPTPIDFGNAASIDGEHVRSVPDKGDSRGLDARPSSSSELWLLPVAVSHLIMLYGLAVFLPAPAPPVYFGPAVMVGMVFAQTNLIACWVALGTSANAVRIVVGLISLAATTGAVVIYVVVTNGPAVIGLAAGGIMLIQLTLMQIPFWYLRRFAGYRLTVDPCLGPPEEGPLHPQYGIRQMLYWTTGIAVVLALGRLLTALNWGQSTEVVEFSVFFTIFAMFSMALAAPTIWSVLATRFWVAWLAVVVVYAIVLTLGQVIGMTGLAGFNSVGVRTGALFHCIAVPAQILWLGATLVLARCCSLRMRCSLAQSPETPTTSRA